MKWKHQPGASQLGDTKYAYILMRGLDLSNASTEPELYSLYYNKMRAHQKALKVAKVEVTHQQISQAIPSGLLKKWNSVRARALDNVKSTIQPSADYEILHKAHILAEEIANQGLLYMGKRHRVNFDIFGSITGRMTTTKDSVPILNLKKENRINVKPTNDAFVELDLNAAEVRTLVALSGDPQPPGDIHEYLMSEIFEEFQSRSLFKERLFAWMYNPNSTDVVFDSFFSKKTYLKHYDEAAELLSTPFGRQIKVEQKKAQNYLLQSTTSDIVISNTYDIFKFLRNRSTNVAFTLHDSVILDFSREDIGVLGEIKSMFEATPWGNFTSTCKVGKNFGSLKEMII